MSNKLILGWREWIGLPTLNIPAIKAKVDTGAKTSALHAFSLNVFHDQGSPMIAFKIHPEQKNTELVVECEAAIIDQRWVTDSGGHKENRYVIQTDVTLEDHTWPTEFTLTNRDTMIFRVLLGRNALKPHYLVDPGKSFIQSKDPHS